MKCPLMTCQRSGIFQSATEGPEGPIRTYQCHNGHLFKTQETWLLGTEEKETPGQPSSAQPSSQEPSSAPSQA